LNNREKMVDIWRNIFKREVHPDTDFFDDLDGDSMAAASIVHWVQIVYGVHLPMVEVFEQPTPASLTEFVDRLLTGAANQAHGAGPR
jgi:acyl carrier protein